MDTEAALIGAIAADFDDDTPRLVYADWLQENGRGERAEFIRAQCSPREDAQARADELLAAHQKEWDAPLAPLEGEALYHRGFPYHLRADLARLADHPELLGRAPGWHLSPTREGHDYDEPQTELCARLAAGPFVARVRGLNLAWAGWVPGEWGALLAPPLLAHLRELRFGDDDDSAAALDLLLGYPELKLEELGFGGDSYGGIGDAGCAILATCPQFASLTNLELPNNDLGPAGALALAGGPHLTRLQSLDLQGGSNSTNTIGDEGAAHLAGSASFRNLTHLNLVANGIGAAGFRALLVSPHLTALESLNLPMNEVSDAALAALAESDGLPALNWLNVSAGFHARIGGAAVARLARSPRMAKLTGLKLGGHPIGTAGARALAESPNCRNLRELHVANCGIGADGLEQLLASPHLAGVREFSTAGVQLSKANLAALKARYPGRVS